MIANRSTDRRPVLRLAPGEVWCRRCGNAGNTSQAKTLDPDDARCPVCGCIDWIDATTVLQPTEYYIAG